MAISEGHNIWELIEENGDGVTNEHWAPVGAEQNDWVQIGWHNGETCKKYKQLFDEYPSFGTSRVDSFEVTGYLMCCLDQSSMNDSLSTAEVTTGTAEDKEKEIEQLNGMIVQTFDPMVYDRNRGWLGSTYNEAMQFCSERESARVLCPFEV